MTFQTGNRVVSGADDKSNGCFGTVMSVAYVGGLGEDTTYNILFDQPFEGWGLWDREWEVSTRALRKIIEEKVPQIEEGRGLMTQLSPMAEKSLSKTMQSIVKAGYAEMAGGEIRLTVEGNRVLMEMLFSDNEKELALAAEAKLAKEKKEAK